MARQVSLKVHKDIFSVVPSDYRNFKRFSIEATEAPPRKKLPNAFIPKVDKIGLANFLIKEILRLNFKLLRSKKYWKVLLSRPCIYGVFSGPVGGFKPIKSKCTGCHRCVLEYPSFCRIIRNPQYTAFPDSYWNQSDPTYSYSPVATINYEAESGKILIKGMGYKGFFAGKGWDSMWTDMSEIVRPTRDGVHGREYISTIVDIGKKAKYLEFNGSELMTTTNTIHASLPIIFDLLPEKMNSESIRNSIASAAERIGTFYYEYMDNIKRNSLQSHSSVIPVVRSRDLNLYTEEIAQAEILAFSNSEKGLYQKIREINTQAILISRIPLRQDIKSSILDSIEEGIDCIHIYATYHGTEFGGSRFLKESLRDLHTFLVNKGLRDQITIIASGGVILAEHVPKAIICGGDLVAIDTAILVALQAEFLGECVSAETGAIVKEEFSSKWGSQRLMNLLGSWHAQIVEILSAMGMRDIRRLRGDVGRAMFNDQLEKEVFGNIDRVY
ncbi:MAG: glutamate synthase-related protein [Candidatus Hodarchaeales archaeon]